MKKEEFHKYLYAGLTGFFVIVCSILFFYILYNTRDIGNIFDKFIGILMPFIIGAVIAYLLTPVSNRISRYVMRLLIRISGDKFEDIVIRQKDGSTKEVEKTKEMINLEKKQKIKDVKKQQDYDKKGKIRRDVVEFLLFHGKHGKEETENTIRRRKYKKLERMADGISIISTLVLAIFLIYLLFAMVIPDLMVSIMGLAEVFPSSLSDFKKLILEQFDGNGEIYDYLLQFVDTLNDNIEGFLTTYLLPNMQSLMTTVYKGVFSTIGVVKNLLIGIIISVYLMGRRRQFMAQGGLVLRSICNEKIADMILEELDIANRMFGGFIRGKLVDSLIIGIICFACMSIFKMPYSLLISVIIGVTNIIPFFGPFIGAVPSAFLVLISNSGGINIMGCIYFLIFILALQQFDGNILGPKILGDSTGLSSFWVLFSILLFGGLFGVIGMVIGVPLFAVIYDIVKKFICASLRKKGKLEEMEKYQRKFHGME